LESVSPRGEVALIVALIGLKMNVISQRSYALVIIVTAVTTVLPPPFLKMLFTAEDTVADSTSSGGLSAEVQVSGQVS
jgi:Kef-type K+ transport system membrane component KefB